MKIAWLRLLVVVVMAVAVAVLVPTATATAGPSWETATGPHLARTSGVYSSALTEASLDPLADRRAGAFYLAAQPNGEQLYCDNAYSFFSSEGTFTIQHPCGGTTAAWGFKIAASLRPSIVGPVAESGLTWTKDGVNQPMMSPHTEAADYQFHGRFSGVPDGTSITYDDHFTFRHSIGSGGNGKINIHGSFTLTGNPPPPRPPSCRPGVPC